MANFNIFGKEINVDVKSAGIGAGATLVVELTAVSLWYLGKKTVAYVKAAHAAGKQELENQAKAEEAKKSEQK